jgi:hypothetical protein
MAEICPSPPAAGPRKTCARVVVAAKTAKRPVMNKVDFRMILFLSE